MPELPEVETIRRGLKNRITGQKILDVAVLSPKNFIGRHADFTADKAELIDQTIESIDRRGKALLLNLSNKLTLMVHLRMTGQLIYVPATGDSPTTRFAGGHPNESFLDSLPNKQTRIVLKLTQGTLFFNDQRKFGFIKVVGTDDVANDPFVSKLAPEPWDYDLEDWRQTLSRRQAPIKAVLLNQELIAGLGNIYADESLFAARIHPARPASTLSRQEAKRLLQAAGYVMQQAIEQGGSTIATYLQPDGSKGNYLDKFACVYGRAGQPCLTCGTTIAKTRIAGRGTCFCPHCQPLEDQA